MPFYNVKGIGTVHLRFGRKKDAIPPCGICRDLSGYLCDFEVCPGVTCDTPLCRDHAHEVGKDRHYCPRHLEESNAKPLKTP